MPFFLEHQLSSHQDHGRNTCNQHCLWFTQLQPCRQRSHIPSVVSLSLNSQMEVEGDPRPGPVIVAPVVSVAIQEQVLQRERALQDWFDQLQLQSIQVEQALDNASPEERQALLGQRAALDRSLEDIEERLCRAKIHVDFVRERATASRTATSALASNTGSDSIKVKDAMTPTERYEDAQQLAKAGLNRSSRETYRQFAQNFNRVIKVCGVKDDDGSVIYYLSQAFAEIFGLLTMSADARGLDVLNGFKSVATFLDTLRRVPGPNYTTPAVVAHKKRTRESGDRSPSRRRKMSHRDVSGSRYHCDKCGDNNTHDTNGCKECTRCSKKGHNAPDCRSAPRPRRML